MSASGRHALPEISAESLSASGRSAEKLSLPSLQSKMKIDPEGYITELALLYSQFKSSLELFHQQAALNFTSISGIGGDPTVAKDLGDRAMFLAHVTPFYPKELANFPKELADLLRSAAKSLPSSLRCHVVQALILLINRQIVDIGETLALFMELQALGDRPLRTLAFSHVIHSIKRMNQKHKNEAKNRALQNILYPMLQEEDEAKAKRALITLCDLHRRKVWFDDRTANAICSACFHTSSRIMIAALSFLLDYEKIENDDDSDNSSTEDDSATPQHQVAVSKEAIYKAQHAGTTSSKKKKKAKLQRVIRSMKKQQRMSSKNDSLTYYSPLNNLKDPQGFAEKLFSRLQTCNERFEVKMMILKVVARVVGLHRLILLNFYPYLQKYVQPHQRDVTNLLAACVQACHDMVPPDAVEPLFRQIVNQFVHDRSRTEAIAVGLNVVREICLRMPLLMTEDLLQDLVLYKKSNEKAVSSAARSLVTLFREVCPSLLIKKDRGRPSNPKARPKAFGEVNVPSNVAGFELLQCDEDNDGSSDDMDTVELSSDGDQQDDKDDDTVAEDDDSENDASEYESSSSADDDHQNDKDEDDGDDNKDDLNVESDSEYDLQEGDEDSSDADDVTDEDDADEDDKDFNIFHKNSGSIKESKAQKRKFSDFDGQLDAANKSLRALKKIAGAKMEHASTATEDGILSNEDFQRIKELKAKEEARSALAKHGLLRHGSDAKSAFKIPSADQLSVKRVDAAKLEANIRKKLTKEERVALLKAGREERGKYQARAAVKQKKTGGSSNRQKEHKKPMPLAAKRAKVAKSRIAKKKKQQSSGKQFRGRKAWK
ncbi:hypothetical protein RJ639_042550 [Escallonia herrerae]|uniref:Protein SDA1 n=1 Tax=Escallonia herrerae TaxID=1293975 RepID=A0AA88WFI2_9ASTE|nr:hypothetical protein RJ639_042550 [Escallonia herrerae]